MSQQINLFNPIFLRQKKHFSALTMAQALGVILVGVLCLYGYSMFRSSGVKQTAAQAAVQLTATQQQLTKVTAEFAPRKQDEALAKELEKAEAEHKAMQTAMSRLKNEEFGDRKGYSAYLSAFARQIVGGLWLTGFSIEGAGSAIGIQGRTLQPESVPAYIGRLSGETVFKGKSFAVLEMQQVKQDEDAAAKHAPQFIEFDLRSSGVEKAAAVAQPKPSVKPKASAPIAPQVGGGAT
ncbi:MAG: putative Mannose-sensitive agglutinin biosis protein MshI [Burkholderiaceae bacterium]|nr:putative Mannose-sensitive agglutinin biosis protein MshI [Burkholderiaceae bacterium]